MPIPSPIKSRSSSGGHPLLTTETLRAQRWIDSCSRHALALGMTSPCIVERPHRLGMLQPEKQGSRPAIAKYLNYAEKAQILQRFRSKGELIVGGHSILLFADYSPEVSRKRKAFGKVCSALFEQQIKFALLYPATLHVTTQNGKQLSFTDPLEAEAYLGSREDAKHMERWSSPPQQQRTPRAKHRPQHNSWEIPNRHKQKKHK